MAEAKNLRKKLGLLKSQLKSEGDISNETEESEESDEEEEKQPVIKSRPIKQRAGVSAEVFGDHNKKENFVPPYFPKSEEVKHLLRAKLL